MTAVARSIPVSSTISVVTFPRATRSSMSPWVSWVVEGIKTAPIFIAASTSSQSGATLGSMTSRRSPFSTPWLASQLATRVDRSRISS